MKNERWSSLDGLRGLAALAVICCHCTLLPRLFYADQFLLHDRVESLLFEICDLFWISVDCFFALSGFLITYILLARKNRAGWIKHFYRSRALRVLPAYFVLLIVYFIGMPLLASSDLLKDSFFHENAFRIYWYLLPGANIGQALWSAEAGGELAHLWSLAAEIQFYICIPLLTVLFSVKRLQLALALGLILLFTLRATCVLANVDPSFIYYFPLTRFDGFLAGALVAALLANPESAQLTKKYVGPITVLLLVLCVTLLIPEGQFSQRTYLLLNWSMHNRTVQLWGYSAVALLSASIIGCLVTRPQSWRLRTLLQSPLLVGIGTVSYGMYLSHPLVIGVLESTPLSILSVREAAIYPVVGDLFYLGLVCTLAAAVGALSYHLVEYPAMNRTLHPFVQRVRESFRKRISRLCKA